MSETNATARLEAFCDGVFAIALTLLIIDVKLPETDTIATTPDFWRALQHVAPTVFAFLLSFVVILITWVNHHASVRLVNKSSASFMYANGFLLLTVVFIPFPTALVGEFILTDHAAPAVVLYEAVLAAQAIGWILLGGTAVKYRLANDERALSTIRENMRHGYFAFMLYALLAVAAFWFPVVVAVITTVTWLFWLVLSIRMAPT